MVTLSSDSRPIIGRGPPLGARFFFLAVFSITLMVLDHRGGYMEQTRSWLQTAMTPLYSVVELPFQVWDWMTGSVSDRSQLRTENTQLTNELREARVKHRALRLPHPRVVDVEARAHSGQRRAVLRECRSRRC